MNERLEVLTGEPPRDTGKLREYSVDWLLYSIGAEQAELQRQLDLIEESRKDEMLTTWERNER